LYGGSFRFYCDNWRCDFGPFLVVAVLMIRANPEAAKAIRKLAKRGDRKTASKLKATKKGK
jgi:hypothetical protein